MTTDQNKDVVRKKASDAVVEATKGRAQFEAASRKLSGRKTGEDTGRTVIVKVLNTDSPTPSEVARFRREYEMVRALEDDSVVRVLDMVSGERATYTLSYPVEADLAAGRLSVLAPIGTAMLVETAKRFLKSG